jgi:hypothetical protein
MAHECPECGQTCYCGGDIDDCCLHGSEEEFMCHHCPDDYDSDDPFNEEEV